MDCHIKEALLISGSERKSNWQSSSEEWKADETEKGEEKKPKQNKKERGKEQLDWS